MQPNDHDLIIRLDTKMDNLTTEVILLRDNSAKRLEVVEKNKLDKEDFMVFQTVVTRGMEASNRKIDVVTRNMYILIGIGIAFQFIAPIVYKFFNLN